MMICPYFSVNAADLQQLTSRSFSKHQIAWVFSVQASLIDWMPNA